MKKDNFYKSYIVGIIIGVIVAILSCHIIDKFTISDEEQDIADIKSDIKRIADQLECDLEGKCGIFPNK